MAQRLTNKEAMDVITWAISDLKNEGLNIKQHYLFSGKLGYGVDIVEMDILNKRKQINNNIDIHDAIFFVQIPFSFFEDTFDPVVDKLAGVKALDSVDFMALKRCKYYIKKACEKFKADLKVVDSNVLKKEVNEIIKSLNRLKGLELAVVASKPDGNNLEVFITSKLVDQEKDNPNTKVALNSEYYTDDYVPLDELIGPDKLENRSWSFKGRVRIAYILYNAVKLWLKNDHPEILAKIRQN